MIAFAFALVTWIRERKPMQRLADVEVPNRPYVPVVLFTWVGQRRRGRAFEDLGKVLSQLGELLGTRMRESDERSRQLLDLQASLEGFARTADERDTHLLGLQGSVERLTRWLVRLTTVLGVIGVAGIAVAVWAALR